jgi:hypothetical protein
MNGMTEGTTRRTRLNLYSLGALSIEPIVGIAYNLGFVTGAFLSFGLVDLSVDLLFFFYSLATGYYLPCLVPLSCIFF